MKMPRSFARPGRATAHVRGIALAGVLAAILAPAVAAPPPGKDENRPPATLRGQGGPKVGDWAPDFTLSTPDGKQTVQLKSFRGQRPVALVFGSYT